MWSMKREVYMWVRVLGTETCPELQSIMIQSDGGRTQDDVGKVTRIQDFRILDFI